MYWDLGLGGIQKRIRDVVTDISRRYDDWDIYILLRRKSSEGFDNQIDLNKRVIIRYYPFMGVVRPPLGYIFWIAWQYLTIAPDTVLTFQCLLSSIAVLCKYIFFWIPAKLVLNEGAVTSQALKWERLSYLSFLIRFLYPLANVIIVPTRACKADLVQKYSVPEKKISVVPNWTLFPPVQSLPPRYDFAFIGRFSPEKNPLFIVQLTKTLLPRYPRLRVAMIGYGSLQTELVDTIHKEKLENHIHIIPFTGNVRTFIRQSRALVVPSFNEGMPNIVLEAAMCGIPSVANNFPGVEEVIIHGKTGYISKSVTEAVSYIKKLLHNPPQRIRMGQHAQRYVEYHYTRNTQQRFINVLLSR